jgi:UDP-3-O-[3-hydroxymyristoyl] glucosamine N-acyltransferase
VTIWGQVGSTSGITIGEKAVILAQSGISKSLEGGKTYFGYPAEESRAKLKELASIKQIPGILEELKSNRNKQS